MLFSNAAAAAAEREVLEACIRCVDGPGMTGLSAAADNAFL
jgi:hypothetical protein